MVLLDAGPLIALARGESAADDVERLIRRGDAAMSAVNLAEAADLLQRLHAVDPARIAELAEVIEIRGASVADAYAAGSLRARHYHRTRCPLSLADCFLLATAASGTEIATSDQAVVDTAGKEGIPVVPVANSRGAKPRRRARG